MNKLCNVASFWIYTYIGLLLIAHPILHISRIRVKEKVELYLYSPPPLGLQGLFLGELYHYL
jgi:hypothetical protein